MPVDLEKIEIINKSSLPDSEKKRLINQILGVKDKKKREVTPQQREIAIERLELARQAKREKAKAMQPTTNINTVIDDTFNNIKHLDDKKVEEIFEKKYNGEFSKLTGLLTDLNNNIGEIKTMKKQKAEHKKRLEEEKASKVPEVQPIVIKAETKPMTNKIAIPNYRNNFKKN